MKVKLLIFSMLISAFLPAQEHELMFGTFRSSVLVNLQTTEMVSPKSFDFTIKHRFGGTGLDSTFYQQFMGLDLPSNIRFGFGLPIGERINIGIGRTKNGKTIDGDIKYALLKQTEDNTTPLSVAFYINAAMRTEKLLKEPDYSFLADSITPFENKFSHRMAYNTQVIIARKFSERLSMLITPSFIYYNLTPVGTENHTIVLSAGAVYRYGTSSSIMLEYSYRFNNQPLVNAFPLSLAWEFGTAGHVFQLIISSSSELIEQSIHRTTSHNYLKGKFALGFNIRRTTWHSKSE